MKRITVLSAFLLITLSAFAYKAGIAVISGTVQDDKNMPFLHATVMLLNSKDSTLVKGDLTNDKGAYQFE